MRNHSHCRALIFFLVLFSTTAHSQIQKIYLHPKAAGGGKQSLFVDSIRFVPLEVKDGIELGNYSNVQVTQKYFLITDFPNKLLLLYARNGSFVKKISFKKLGQQFYPRYHDDGNEIVFWGRNKNYSLTQKDELKIKLNWNNPHSKKYFKKYKIDLDDSALEIKKAVPTENDIVEANQLYDDLYWRGKIETSELYKDSLEYELKLYKNDKLVKSFFPYNHINEPRYLYADDEQTVAFEADTPYIHFVTRPFCDTIYKVVKDSIFPAYQLVLPLENSLPSTFFTKAFKNKTERENFRRNNGWMLHQVYSFYETQKLIYFGVGYQSNYDTYVYDKKNNVTYKTKNIRPDSSQYNLQLVGNFSLEREGGRFYKTQKASELIAFFEQNKSVAVPKELETFLKSNPPAATPVIVEFKLKN